MTKTLDEIMSGRGEAMAEPAPTNEEATTEINQEAAPEPQAPEGTQDEAPEPEGQSGQSVPLARLEQERSKVKRYTEQVAEFQKRLDDVPTQISAAVQQAMQSIAPLIQAQQQPRAPQPPAPAPDLYEDPTGFVQHQIEPLAQGQQAMREQFSQMLAIEKYGAESVQKAYATFAQAMQTDPAAKFEYQRIMASPHPYGELVSWHKKHETLSRLGPDPDAYINQEVERRLAERTQAQQPQPVAAQPAPQLPSSFAQARNPGPRGVPQWSGPKPLSEIMPK